MQSARRGPALDALFAAGPSVRERDRLKHEERADWAGEPERVVDASLGYLGDRRLWSSRVLIIKTLC